MKETSINQTKEEQRGTKVPSSMNGDSRKDCRHLFTDGNALEIFSLYGKGNDCVDDKKKENSGGILGTSVRFGTHLRKAALGLLWEGVM